MKKRWQQWLNDRWPLWAAGLLQFLAGMVRMKVVRQENLTRYGATGFAIWHRDELAMLPHFGKIGATILISPSRDGGYLAMAAEKMGYRAVRGSSTRGAVGGLVALIKSVRDGRSAIVAVDGPQGPKGVCKPGIVKLAQKTGVPVIPVSAAASPRFLFRKTWHQTYFPLPFGRQAVVVGEPLWVSPDLDQQAEEQLCRRIEQALLETDREAEDVLTNWKRY